MSRWVVVLAGGVGARFWPLSTPERPKQLLPLVTGRPLLRDTLDRVRPLADPAHTLILTNASLVPAIHALVPEVPPDHLIAVTPCSRLLPQPQFLPATIPSPG